MIILLINAVHCLISWKKSSYSYDTEETYGLAFSRLDVERWSDSSVSLLPKKEPNMYRVFLTSFYPLRPSWYADTEPTICRATTFYFLDSR